MIYLINLISLIARLPRSNEDKQVNPIIKGILKIIEIMVQTQRSPWWVLFFTTEGTEGHKD